MLSCQLELLLFKDNLNPNKYTILSIIKNKKSNKHQRIYISFPKAWRTNVLYSDGNRDLFFVFPFKFEIILWEAKAPHLEYHMESYPLIHLLPLITV